jgi:tetratricopeptide (TPR) repeat protein
LVIAHGANLVQKRQKHLDSVVEEFKQKVAWWEKTYPKGAAPKSKEEEMDTYERASAAQAAAILRRSTQRATATPARPTAMLADMATSNAPRAESAPEGTSPTVIGLALKKWTADAPYITRMSAATADTIYAVYLDEKPSYTNSSAFFLDAADMLFDKGRRDLALRVLSNLAEMDLENRQVLRILGYRLLQAGEPGLATTIFEKVQTLAEEEPQSFRDLGLAFAAAGHYQQAIDQLNEVIQRPWGDRFAEIELIALAEMNAIIAGAPNQLPPLDTSRIDSRLLKNLPLDLRAVLTWDADNSDMDLWVTDPNGEKCYYAHRLTYQGGRMSRDFTGGYGPEEFSLRQAKPGKYRIETNFYGSRQQVVAGATTLQVKLTSGFGTDAAKDQMITLRLKGKGDSVFVGEFEVKPK